MLIDILYNSLIYYFIFNLTYYSTSLVLFLVDYYKLFLKFRNQQDKIDILISTYKKITPTILMNTLVYIIPSIFLSGIYETYHKEDFYLKELLYILPGAFVLTDVFFYIFHRIMHIPILYRNFHKKHHEIIAPVGMSAVYTTGVDLYLGNILPIYLPMYIFSAHPITFKIWMVMSTFNTVIFAHSGYKWFAEYHDFHHSNFNKNFGINLFMDRVFGTSY